MKIEITDVVFDLGGVLIQIAPTWGSIAGRLALTLPGLNESNTSFDTCIPHLAYQSGTIDEAAYLAALTEQFGGTANEMGQLHDAMLIELYAGIDPFLAELRRIGLRTGCLSNTNDRHWRVLTSERFPAIANLDCKMASHLEGIQKPDPEIFRRYCDRFAVNPAAIAYFDDRPENVAAASSVGFHAFRVDPLGDTAGQMRDSLGQLGLRLSD